MSPADPVKEVGGGEEFLRAEKFQGSGPVPTRIVWSNVAIYAALHLGALYGLWLGLTEASWATLLLNAGLYVVSGLGVTAGAHRLWAHRTYEARPPLRVFLALANVLAFQNDVIEWSRDHRGHHKWSETSADPHDASRGLFFSHLGWLLCRKHPDVVAKGRTVDLSDLFADPVLRWQRRNYFSLALLVCAFLPTVLPNLLWGEALGTAYFVALARYVLGLHATWCVNSLAHRLGDRPYDPAISPTQSPPTSLVALGEGWHNFHHSFPQDYRASEFPYLFNFTTAFIDGAATLGLVKGRKVTNQERVERKKERAAVVNGAGDGQLTELTKDAKVKKTHRRTSSSA